jgi:hypothetical protein
VKVEVSVARAIGRDFWNRQPISHSDLRVDVSGAADQD